MVWLGAGGALTGLCRYDSSVGVLHVVSLQTGVGAQGLALGANFTCWIENLDQ